MPPAPPPPEVAAAFGCQGRLVPVDGGQGMAWRAGPIFLKPTSAPEETCWRAEVLAGLPTNAGFRVARPAITGNGDWVAGGWEAWHAVAGTPDASRFRDTLAAGEAFHRAVAHIGRPVFLDRRDDPWSIGDRLAWSEQAVTGDEVLGEQLVRLAAARRPVQAADQPVHGDLLGNVLFADPLPPAIIDWPVYYRPAAWASAVAVVDALTWYGAPASLLEHGQAQPDWAQMLIRALIFRIGTQEGRRRHGLPPREYAEQYEPVMRLVLRRSDDG